MYFQDFELVSGQAVAMFERPITSGMAARLFKGIPLDWEETFDSEPEFVAFGGDLPPEIPLPVFRLKNNAETLSLAVTKQRIEFIFGSKPPDSAIDLKAKMAEAGSLISAVIEMLPPPAKVNRFAAVIERVSRIEFTAKMLAAKFCNSAAIEGPYKRPQTFELHAHKVFDVSFDRLEVKLNSWVRQKSTQRIDDGSNVVVIEQDMNTVIPHSPYSSEDALCFFSNIPQELEKCFKTYYAEGQQ